MTRNARRAWVIVNPRAGSGRAGVVVSDLRTALQDNGLSPSIHFTEGPGHASRLATTAVGEVVDDIVCVGGDGTLNEVVNGVLSVGRWPDGLRVAVLPLGTANSFVRDFGLRSGQWREAIKRLREGRSRQVDAALATTDSGFSRYFVNNSGSGFMAQVAQAANRWVRVLGASGYSAAVFWELIRLTAPMTHVKLSGPQGETTTDARLSMVAVCNTQWTGDQMWIAPNADASDGLLDVISVGIVSRLDLVRTFPRVFTGTHLGHPLIASSRAHWVRIAPSAASPVVLDGEVLTHTPVQIQVVPAAVAVAL